MDEFSFTALHTELNLKSLYQKFKPTLLKIEITGSTVNAKQGNCTQNKHLISLLGENIGTAGRKIKREMKKNYKSLN
jgi:hypothetical protein